MRNDGKTQPMGCVLRREKVIDYRIITQPTVNCPCPMSDRGQTFPFGQLMLAILDLKSKNKLNKETVARRQFVCSLPRLKRK